MLFFLMTNKITKYTLKANKKLFKKLDRSFSPKDMTREAWEMSKHKVCWCTKIQSILGLESVDTILCSYTCLFFKNSANNRCTHV